MPPGEKKNRDRPAAVAGKFYPASAEQLSRDIKEMLEQSKKSSGPGFSPRAIIVPHAGYVFSGKVAAAAFNRIIADDYPGKVFVIASSHRMHFTGASVFCAGDYVTPLGRVQVDCETGRKLAEENEIFTTREDAHLAEHSLEVQLPFLQYILDQKFGLIPIILGTRNQEDCRKIAEALEPFFIPGNLFVFSSDFSHYPGYEDAVSNDRITAEAILTNSPGKLLSALENNSNRKTDGLVTSLCGWTSVLVLLYLTTGKNYRYEWIDYRNSGDQPLYGDHDRVVGYSAIAVYEEKEIPFSLNPGEKEYLLQIAKESVREMVMHGRRTPLSDELITGSLALAAGAFVSLYSGGNLRGCIGSFGEEVSLAEVVNRVAASATGDRRFDPVGINELDNLEIEISVLTPLKKITSPQEIVLGKHGIYIKKGWSSGTFLPQVATKYGWTLEEFLGRCARDKAGIGWDGWKSAELFVYEAIIFRNSEKQTPKS